MYFKKHSIPELQNFDQKKKIEILKSISPDWFENLVFYSIIGLSCWLGKVIGMTVFFSTQSQLASIITGATLVLVIYGVYELLLLNFVTRKKVASKLSYNQGN